MQINGFAQNDFSIPTLPQVSPLTESQIVELSPTDCDYKFPERAENFRCLSNNGSANVSLIFGSFKKELHIVAIDENPDGKSRFERLVIDEDSEASNGFLATIKQGEWFPLELNKNNLVTVGLYAKLLKLDTHLNEVKIYFGAAFRNGGYPNSFVEKIEKEVGFAVGGPDYQGYLQDKITIETLLEQAHRETGYMQKAALYCINNLEFDLLLYDHPILDRYGHYLYGTSTDKFPVMKDGYIATDKNLKAILKAIDNDTALLIVSGHGFSEAHTSFSLLKIFDSMGVKISPAENADIAVIASKLSAHIYLNNRNLSESGKRNYLQSLKQKLENYKDKNTGKTIIDKVLFPNEMKRFHLYNPTTSGDLWICLKAGYTFDGVIAPYELRGQPTFVGEHGYFDRSPEAKGFFSLYSQKKITLTNRIKDSTDIMPIIFNLLKNENFICDFVF
ncbi:MAG: alkaline phosphatase family protein [Acidobacteriota bacterium]